MSVCYICYSAHVSKVDKVRTGSRKHGYRSHTCEYNLCPLSYYKSDSLLQWPHQCKTYYAHLVNRSFLVPFHSFHTHPPLICTHSAPAEACITISNSLPRYDWVCAAKHKKQFGWHGNRGCTSSGWNGLCVFYALSHIYFPSGPVKQFGHCCFVSISTYHSRTSTNVRCTQQ